MPKDAPPNGGAPAGGAPMGPRRRVLEMQAKRHRWAAADPGRRFDDLFNFVCVSATLIVACDRVAGIEAGILTELGENKDTHTGTPQGGILSPLLANIALSVLDGYLHGRWQPAGEMATSSSRVDVEALREGVAQVLQPLGLRLSESKTRVVHMGEGFDFFGFRIQWRRSTDPTSGTSTTSSAPGR